MVESKNGSIIIILLLPLRQVAQYCNHYYFNVVNLSVLRLDHRFNSLKFRFMVARYIRKSVFAHKVLPFLSNVLKHFARIQQKVSCSKKFNTKWQNNLRHSTEK